VALVGVEEAQKKASVCIGSTSARVCGKLGLTRVSCPDAPGIDTWVECVLDVIKEADLVA
jgi:uroporphyrinogen-III synthase